MSQRHRHGYAADFPRDLHDLRVKTCREVLAANASSDTHRVRPKSARLESVSELKDVTTPVPRVLLSITLAGPAPSGSTGHVPALSGLLPILSGTTRTELPSATPNRYDGQAVQVFHLHSNNRTSRRNQLTLTRRGPANRQGGRGPGL